MPKRFLKRTVNWVELEKRVPKDQTSNFLAFKGKSEEYWRRVKTNPEKPPEIDWEAYKKAVPVPGLVDKLKKQYQDYKVPYPEDKLSASIDKQWTEVEAEIKTYKAEREKDIAAADKELQRINALPKFEDMTMEMYKDMYPNEAIDPVAKPTYWPHTAEEQVGYEPPAFKAAKK